LTARFIYPAPQRKAAFQAACEQATMIPGVTGKVTRDGEPYVIIPDNAYPLVARLFDDCKGRVWSPPADKRVTLHDGLEEIEEIRWAERGVSIAATVGSVVKRVTLTDYQRAEPAAWRAKNVLFHHAPGAGKSLTSMLWSLLSDGPIVIVTTARARMTWQREISRYTTISPLIVTGEEPYVTNHEFVAGQSEKNGRVLVGCGKCGRRDEEHLFGLPRITVVSWEILPFHVGWISDRKPTTLVMDESHRAKQRKRVAMVPVKDQQKPPANAKQLDDGRWVTFEPLENIANAAAKLARACARRCLTTATPVKNRRRDLWAQLDYLEPWGWGGYWSWARRYCAASPTGFNGAMTDDGKSNTPELQRRLDMVRSRVPLAVSHAALPKLRRDLFPVAIADQCKSDITRAELKAASARGESAALELALMDACAKKRKAVCAAVFEQVAGSRAKVVIFTGRRADCDAYGADMRKLLAKNPEVAIWSSHGGDSEADRQKYVDEYYAAEGPAVFIGTGDAFGESINGLHDTDVVYTAMLPWTPGDVIQREYRFVRQGSTRAVLVYYVIAEGTVDEHVVGKVIDKLPDTLMVGHEEMETFRQTLRGGTSEQLVAGLAAAILKGATP
jgi:hypothetical protein